MRNLLTTILLLFLTTSIFAQKKELEQVDTDKYRYTQYNDNGKITQTGYYVKVGNTLEEHGIWRDVQNGTIAEFEMGKMVWIKPKGERKITYEEIQIHRLTRKVEQLKELVASNDI